jgi:hypothetical protein
MKISPPAFPTYLADNMAHGMSLRDFFAATAMQGFCSNSYYNGIDHNDLAIWSYEVADRMIKAREQ